MGINKTGHGQENAIITNSCNSIGENSAPCLWMQAGAVKEKFCDNFYNCADCSYDLERKEKVLLGEQISWQDAMRTKEGLHRVCQHSLTNRIENRSCPSNYNCSSCDFDQYFEDVLTPKTKNDVSNMETVKGFDAPREYYFHQGHTWARIESGGNIRIGIDDFAMKLFGEADSMELPLTGKALKKGETAFTFERGGNEAEFLSPVNGIIVEVNADVRTSPAMVNTAPYEEGWLFSIHVDDIKEAIEELMAGEARNAWISDEVAILEKMVEEVAGPLAADGGHFSKDLFGTIPDIGWDNLTRTFLTV